MFVLRLTELSDFLGEVCTDSCPPNVKAAAYKGLVRPVLEYGSSVWDTHGLQEELEKVQNRAARLTGN